MAKFELAETLDQLTDVGNQGQACALPNIRNIGFFHLGSADKQPPHLSLREALKSSPQVCKGESPIVLPEGFNYTRGYCWKAGEPDLSIDAAIQNLSAEFSVAFVAGLMEPLSAGRRYNSAFLIDGGTRRLLARKREDDGFFNYECATCNRPHFHRGVWIAALVCVDGFGFNEARPKECQRNVLASLASRPSKVLCVPATTHDHGTVEIAQRWAAHLPIVIANADNNQPSVAQVASQSIAYRGTANKACVIAMCPTD